jgi:hypothetical protein
MGESQMLKMFSIYAALSFMLVSSAMAQDTCGADIKKACANIEPGSGRIATCLKEHLKDISEGCKGRLAEIAAAGKACRAEVSSKCGDQRRRTQKIACIRDALADLSDDCKNAMTAAVTGKK